MKEQYYIISTYSQKTTVDRDFLKLLKKVANHYKAKSLLIENDFAYDENGFKVPLPRELDYFSLVEKDLILNENLEIKLIKNEALLIDPLAGLQGAFPDKSVIVPGLIMSLNTEPSPRLCKQLMTTGSVGRVRESSTVGRSGRRWAIAREFIVPSALLVHVKNDKIFFTRYLSYRKSGVLYDLNLKFTLDKEKPTIHRPEAINRGDDHVAQQDPAANKASNEMINFIRPKAIILNDAFDGVSCSYRDSGKTADTHNRMSIAHEAKITKEFILTQTKLADIVYYLDSNHDDFLTKFLDNRSGWITDSKNYPTCIDLEAARSKGKRPIVELLGLDKIPKLKYIPSNDKFYIANVMVAHGARGVRGARPNFKALAKVFNYYSQGHTHSPAIFRNAVCVGLNGILNMEYNSPSSGWVHGNGLIHEDGSQQLIPIIDGLWR